MPEGPSKRFRRLPAVRNVSAAVTVLAVAALGAFAASDAATETTHTVTKHTTVVKLTEAPKSQQPGQPAASETSTAAGPLVPAALLTAGSLAPTSDPSTVATVGSAVPTASPPATPAATSPPTTTTPTTTTPSPTDLPACPLPLSEPTPTQQGGLASLVGLSPLFGPYSSEAFAAAPLFQPLLQAFGPFLVTFANGYTATDPSLVPLTSQVESLENSSFTAISPFYGPYRNQFLTAETDLATALAPLAKAAAANAATSCLVDIEGVLTSAAPAS
jgi:hypothetical protein